jgi:hypothetical protein
MDAIHRETNDVVADGEGVWSWPPDAEAKLAGVYERCERRGQESPVPGESAL